MFFTQSLTGMWLAVMIIALAVEAIIPGLVSIWFAAGALVALVIAALKLPEWLQIAVFLVVSLAALIVTRPLAQKYITSKAQPTNADMIIGRECIVKEEINNVLGTGAVVAGGKTWTAVSWDPDVVIPVESRAVVERIEGVKAVVKLLTEE